MAPNDKVLYNFSGLNQSLNFSDVSLATLSQTHQNDSALHRLSFQNSKVSKFLDETSDLESTAKLYSLKTESSTLDPQAKSPHKTKLNSES